MFIPARGRGARRLVLLSSTWGPSSLLGRRPELPAELVAALPVDEYQVALAAHPNIWHGHGAWQVRSWLAAAERAGLAVLPPRSGWQAALVAADHVIGDHGSVTAYGAALGTHTMLAAFPHHELDPRSPVARLGREATELRSGEPLREQIVADHAQYSPERLRMVTEPLCALPGESGPVLRAALYRLMGLEEPDRPVRLAPPEVPVPLRRGWPEVGSTVPLLVAAAGGPTQVHVERRPAALADRGDGSATAVDGARESRHLLASTDEPNPRWRHSADVLLYVPEDDATPGSVPGSTEEHWPQLSAALQEHPGARYAIAAAGNDCLLATRAGRRYRLAPEGDTTLDPAVFASAFWRVRSIGGAVAGPLTVHAGGHRVPVRITSEA
jgi:hypothetical protein